MPKPRVKHRWIWERINFFLKDAAVRYFGGVFALLLAGVGAEVISSTLLTAGTVPAELLRSLGEAALVSGLLAILVDPYLKSRLQHESAWSALFGYLNPHAPKELKEALQDLAACKRYYSQASWTVNFEWQDKTKTVLQVTINSVSTGTNIDKRPYKPNGRPWVLASCEGFQTEYLRYSLSCPGYFAPLDVQGEELNEFVTRRNDGSIFVNETALVGNRTVPPGVSFEGTKRARMYRHTTAYLPLHHAKFVDNLPFVLMGPALRDLDVIVAHPQHEGRRLPTEWKIDGQSVTGPERRDLGRATPGQITLLSWSPALNTSNLK